MSFFRFCDLSKEIRILVYEECFAGAYIRMCRRHYYVHSSVGISSNHGPPLLQVSRLIRQECLPIFTKSIEYVDADCYSTDLAKIPPAYLTHVAKVRLADPDDFTLPNQDILPNLQLLRIQICPEGDTIIEGASSREEVEKAVTKRAKFEVSGSPVELELEKRRSKNQLAFKVLLEFREILYYAPDRRYGYFWDHVVVDWEKEEIVEGWPPPPYDTDDEESDDGLSELL